MILACAALVGGVVGGCGGSTSGTSSGPVPQSQFPARFESAVCDNIGSCCQSGGYKYDAAGCKSVLDQNFGQLFSSKNTVYSASAAGPCIDSVSAAFASCKGFDGVSADACQKVFIGTQPAGGSCTSSTECKPVANAEVYCNHPLGAGGQAGSGQGTCTVKPRGKKGDGCDETCTENGNVTGCSSSGGGGAGGGGGAPPSGNATCYTNDGLYCAGNGVCTELSPIGQACTSYNSCVDGAYCDSNNTCAKKKAAGSSCSSFSNECKDGAYCADPTHTGTGTGTCTNKKVDGQACSSFEECQSDDCQNGKCSSGSSGGISPAMCSGHMNTGGTGGALPGGGGTGGSFNGADAG